MEAVDTSWPRLTAMVSARAAEIKVKVLILVLLILIAMLVIPLLKNNACLLLVIGLKKRNLNLRNLLIILPKRTQKVPLSFTRPR